MARPVHTHYDNLKVARSAPVEVIRAAYRALAKQYHPDQNTSPDAARVMKLLNAAWEVLGDPVQRAQHDVWIAEQEHANASEASAHAARAGSSARHAPKASDTRPTPAWQRAQGGAELGFIDSVLHWLRHARKRHLALLGTGVAAALALWVLIITEPTGAQWEPAPKVKSEMHPLPATAAEVGHPLNPIPLPASSPLPSSPP
jgi:DnaJ-domain-containing protein 1